MTPPLLILPTAPIPGAAYALRSIVPAYAGTGLPDCTAVYRGMVHREEAARTAKSVFYYRYDLAQFVDEATGEVLEFEIEVNE